MKISGKGRGHLCRGNSKANRKVYLMCLKNSKEDTVALEE